MAGLRGFLPSPLLLPGILVALAAACGGVDRDATSASASGAGGAPTTSASTGATGDVPGGGPTTTPVPTSSSSTAQSSGSGPACMPTGAETCAVDTDEDCDGTECAIWTRLYDLGVWASATETAIASNGDVFLTGKLDDASDTLDFAGQTITAEVSGAAFLAKLSSQGDELWIRKLPSDSTIAYVFIGATDTSVLVYTPMQEATDFGGGPLATKEGGESALVAFDAATGDHRWSTTFEDAGTLSMQLSGISPSNHAVIVGHAVPGAAYHGTTFVDPVSGSAGDWYGLAVDVATGHLVWQQSWPATAMDTDVAGALAFGPLGDIYLTSQASSDVAFGGPALVHAGGAAQGFMAHLDAAGQWLDGGWMCVGCSPRALAVGAAGQVAVAVRLDPGAFDLPNPQGFEYAILGIDERRLTDWIVYVSNDANIAMTSGGEVAFLYSDWGSMVMDGQEVPAIGDEDLLLGRIGTDGTLLWHRQLGASGASVHAAAMRPFGLQPDGKGIGAVALSGAPVDLGTGTLTPAGTEIGIVQFAMQ